MKKLVFLMMIIFVVTVYAANGDGKKLTIGDKALYTDVKMLDVSGEKISLKDASRENGIVVLFSCNSCPFVLQWEDRYSDIKAWADKNKVGMIVLNSNHQKRDGDDSYEAMKKHASEKGYNFYYAVDENSLLANSFGGQTTPHAFVFDGEMELVYKGAIDDSYKSADNVKQAYLKEAVASLGNGKKVALSETKPVGCSIKRKTD